MMIDDHPNLWCHSPTDMLISKFYRGNENFWI